MIVTLAESDPRLRSGMSATARLELDRIDRALLVPSSAVVERDGVTVVYVLSGTSLAPRPVTIERRGRDRVALAGGVEAGTRVALNPPDDERNTP